MADLTVTIDGKDNLSGELKRIESGVIRFVGAVSSALTAITIFGFPIREAAEFQKELLNAARTTDYNKQQLLLLKTGLRELSTQINVTAVDLAKMATLGGQAGIGGDGNVAALLDFTEAVSVAVVALDLSAEEVVSSFGKLVTVFNIPPTQFRNAISALTAVGNASNATSQQLFDVVRRTGNLGGSVTFPEAAALSASLIDLGVSTEVAGTSLTKIFADFKAKAPEFAALVKSDLIPTTEAWLGLADKKGIQALNAYADALNDLSTEDAAVAKSQLTGQGRLFEVVSKIQEQRRRELFIAEQLVAVEARQKAVAQGRLAVSDTTRRSIDAQVVALREAATQANVTARLTKAANDAFLSGDAGEKSQATQLSGLLAQWDVFLNNVTALATTAGDTFLSPFTRALRGMSEALQDPVNADNIRRGAEEITAAVHTIIDAFQSVADAISVVAGTGVDWGAVIQVGALLAGAAALKGVISLLSLFGAKAVLAVPGLTSLTNALFGVAQAGAAAEKGAAAAGAGVQRVGGFFANTKAQVISYAEATGRLVAAQDRVNASLLATQALRARAQANVDGAFSNRALASLRDVPAIQARITSATNAMNAAIAAGNNRSAGGYRGQITQLTRLLATIQTNQRAVDAYTKRLDTLNARQRFVTQRVEAPLLPALTNLPAATSAALASARAAGVRLGTALSTGFTQAAQGRTGVTRLLAGFAGFAGAAGTQGRLAGRALGDGIARGLERAIGALASVSLATRTALLQVVGLGAAYQAAGTRIARNLVLVTAGFSLLGKAVGLVGSLISRAFAFGFLVIMSVTVLKAVGLWDKLAERIQNVIKWLGFKVPSFLITNEQARSTAREIDRITKSAEEANKAAGRFTATMEAMTIALQDPVEVGKLFTYDPAEPEKIRKNVAEGIDALLTQYSKLASLQSDIRVTDIELIAARVAQFNITEKLTVAEEEYARTREGTRGQRVALKELEELRTKAEDATLAVSELEAAKSTLGRQAAGLSNTATELANLASATLSLNEAQALLGDTAGVPKGLAALPPIQRYLDLTVAIKDTEERLKALQIESASAKGVTSTEEERARLARVSRDSNLLTAQLNELSAARDAVASGIEARDEAVAPYLR